MLVAGCVVVPTTGPAEPIEGELRVVAGDIEGDSLLTWLKTLLSDQFEQLLPCLRDRAHRCGTRAYYTIVTGAEQCVRVLHALCMQRRTGRANGCIRHFRLRSNGKYGLFTQRPGWPQQFGAFRLTTFLAGYH